MKENLFETYARMCEFYNNSYCNILLGLTCLVLHNSFGFGQKRCEVVCDRMLAMFARMDTDCGITLKQIEEAADKLGNVKAIL